MKFPFKSIITMLVMLVTGTVSVQAQREHTLFRHYHLSGIWGGSKHQMAQFGDTRSYMRGSHLGLEFGKRLFVGYSDMYLKSDVKWDEIQDQNFGLNWRGGTVGYSFASYKAIHPIINVDFGPGKVRYNNSVDNIFAVQPSAGVEINIFRWLHLGIEGGYRFISDTNIEGLNDSRLSGAFGQASLRFGWSWGRSHCNKHKSSSDNNSND